MGEGEGKAEGRARGENKGGQTDASGRRQADAQRAAKQMRKPAERQAGEATAAALLPPQMGAPRLPGLPSSREGVAGAQGEARSRQPLCSDPRRGRGPKPARPSRGRPRARQSPHPRSGRPLPFPICELFVPVRGPGPQGGQQARGALRQGRRSVPTCLCGAAPGAPWAL